MVAVQDIQVKGITPGEGVTLNAKRDTHEIFGVDFSQPRLSAQNAEVQVGPGTGYNNYYKNSFIMNYSGLSFIDAKFNVAGGEAGQTLLFDMVHLTSMANGAAGINGYSPINITINGKKYVFPDGQTTYDPVDGNYKHDRFEVSNYLHEGENEIRIGFERDATTNYWIQSLKLIAG